MNKGMFFGLFTSGLAIGWMVGASGNPVAGAAIPVVFGIVAAAFSYIGAKQAGKVDPVLAAERLQATLSAFGWGLCAFFIALCLGMIVGATARIHDWFGSLPKSKGLPWGEEVKPATMAEAVELIALSEKLTALGYSSDSISKILSLPQPKLSGVTTNSPAPVSSQPISGPLPTNPAPAAPIAVVPIPSGSWSEIQAQIEKARNNPSFLLDKDLMDDTRKVQAAKNIFLSPTDS